MLQAYLRTLQETNLRVKLLCHTPDPLRILYAAYRTCYSKKSPMDLWDQSDGLDPEKITQFIFERLKTGHTSPLEQVVFWFGIEGLSRVASHQLVRHRIGISFEQQSQRYIKLDTQNFKKSYSIPKTWQQSELLGLYQDHIQQAMDLYQKALENGIPPEDARFILPQATVSNLQVCVNYAELLHIADLRLCFRAQWEIRKLVLGMRREVKKAQPLLGTFLQPKCGPARQGFCDEPYGAYKKCPLSRARPHKQDVYLDGG